MSITRLSEEQTITKRWIQAWKDLPTNNSIAVWHSMQNSATSNQRAPKPPCYFGQQAQSMLLQAQQRRSMVTTSLIPHGWWETKNTFCTSPDPHNLIFCPSAIITLSFSQPYYPPWTCVPFTPKVSPHLGPCLYSLWCRNEYADFSENKHQESRWGLI